jgi:hypothetical protein
MMVEFDNQNTLGLRKKRKGTENEFLALRMKAILVADKTKRRLTSI